MRDTHAEDLSILRLLDVSGGFYAGAFADDAARARCLENGWIIPEGETGFALTLEGSCVLHESCGEPGA